MLTGPLRQWCRGHTDSRADGAAACVVDRVDATVDATHMQSANMEIEMDQLGKLKKRARIACARSTRHHGKVKELCEVEALIPNTYPPCDP